MPFRVLQVILLGGVPVAKLLGQMQGPITNLALVLNGPVAALTRVLQRCVDVQKAGTAEDAEV